MQFVQIKPCNLYQTAQQQLKKAEEVKKLKEVQKEEPEEWQNVSMTLNMNITIHSRHSQQKSLWIIHEWLSWGLIFLS